MTQKANPVTLTLINLRRSRHHHPLNLLNHLNHLNHLNPLNPHTEGVSNATTALFPLFFHKQGPM